MKFFKNIKTNILYQYVILKLHLLGNLTFCHASRCQLILKNFTLRAIQRRS